MTIQFRNLTLNQVSQTVAGRSNRAAYNELATQMLTAAKTGTGVFPDRLPTPRVQSGLECQIMALINGIQAIRGRNAIEDLVGRVDEFRQRATEITDSESSRQNMFKVNEVFWEEGYLDLIPDWYDLNPVRVVENLFVPGRFMAVSLESQFHAFAILPVRRPDKRHFVWKIDSLGGSQQYLSLKEFLQLLFKINRNPLGSGAFTFKVNEPQVREIRQSEPMESDPFISMLVSLEIRSVEPADSLIESTGEGSALSKELRKQIITRNLRQISDEGYNTDTIRFLLGISESATSEELQRIHDDLRTLFIPEPAQGRQTEEDKQMLLGLGLAFSRLRKEVPSVELLPSTEISSAFVQVEELPPAPAIYDALDEVLDDFFARTIPAENEAFIRDFIQETGS